MDNKLENKTEITISDNKKGQFALIMREAVLLFMLLLYVGGRLLDVNLTSAVEEFAAGQYTVAVPETFAKNTIDYEKMEDPLQDVMDWKTQMNKMQEQLTEGEIILTDENRSDYVDVIECKINQEQTAIYLSAKVEQIPESDDAYFYLFALESYQNIDMMEEPIGCAIKANDLLIGTPFDATGDTRPLLFDRFVICLKDDGEYVPCTTEHYVTNPEVIADNQMPELQAESIKGLLLDPDMIATEDFEELGCKQIVYNIPIGSILSETSDEKYPTIRYHYDGKTYDFNGYLIAGYDGMFRYLRSQDIVITAIILNNKTEEHPELIHPLSRDAETAYYYEFNTVEEKGAETVEAVASFLAQRYASESNGLVSNWIISNEINQRATWNYIEDMGVEDYAATFEKSFRVFYQAIKSRNANANVYFSLDQMWNANDGTDRSFYNGKELLDVLAKQIREKGDMNWGLALHPYSYPLTKVDNWMDEADYTESASVVSMKNIEVATDYMQQDEMLTENGEVRSVILSEVGYTSLAGEDMQAAAFAYGYYVADANEYIDALLINRMTDSPEELAQGLALGLQTTDHQQKYIWNVFKKIDTDMEENATDFALSILDVDEWEEVIK